MTEAHPEARATPLEIEIVATMLRIAADIDHYDAICDRGPSSLRASNRLVGEADMLRARAEQAAELRACPVLRKMVQDHVQHRR